ncbi:MAG: nitrous oxide reductase family maturation protein NosD [Candidatus Bathyarchaeia archaeon]
MKPRAILLLTLLACAVLSAAASFRVDAASPAVVIRYDGSVSGTSRILRSGSTYTFTGDVNGTLFVNRDNVVIDGAGYTLQGTGVWELKGVDLTARQNVTVKNLAVKSFQFGVWMERSRSNTIINCNITWNGFWGVKVCNSSTWNTIQSCSFANNYQGAVQVYGGSSGNMFSGNTIGAHAKGISIAQSEGNTVSGNEFDDNDDGIVLAADRNTIAGNTFTGSFNRAVFLNAAHENNITANDISDCGVGVLCSASKNNVVSGNDFVGNYIQALTFNATDMWTGNFWSDYNGTGTQPYVIDAVNRDSQPLLETSVIPEFPLSAVPAFLAGAALVAVVAKKRMRRS